MLSIGKANKNGLMKTYNNLPIQQAFTQRCSPRLKVSSNNKNKSPPSFGSENKLNLGQNSEKKNHNLNDNYQVHLQNFELKVQKSLTKKYKPARRCLTFEPQNQSDKKYNYHMNSVNDKLRGFVGSSKKKSVTEIRKQGQLPLSRRKEIQRNKKADQQFVRRQNKGLYKFKTETTLSPVQQLLYWKTEEDKQKANDNPEQNIPELFESKPQENQNRQTTQGYDSQKQPTNKRRKKQNISTKKRLKSDEFYIKLKLKKTMNQNLLIRQRRNLTITGLNSETLGSNWNQRKIPDLIVDHKEAEMHARQTTKNKQFKINCLLDENNEQLTKDESNEINMKLQKILRRQNFITTTTGFIGVFNSRKKDEFKNTLDDGIEHSNKLEQRISAFPFLNKFPNVSKIGHSNPKRKNNTIQNIYQFAQTNWRPWSPVGDEEVY